jgi:hypothetical protein
MVRLRKLLGLPPTEFRLLSRAALVLMAMRLALWLLPPHLRERLLRGPARRPALGTASSPETIGWSVTTASRVIPRATCLVQALAARLLLQQAGHPAELHIGVARDGDGLFQAHAWVESRGRVVIGYSEPGLYKSMQAL